MADPAFEEGKFLTIMSTAPAAVPKMAVQASFRSGRTSFLKLDGLSATPNSFSMAFTLLSCSPRTCSQQAILSAHSSRCHGGLAG